MKCRHGISVRKSCFQCEAENGQEGSKSALSDGLDSQLIELKKALKSILKTQGSGHYAAGYFWKTIGSIRADEIERLEKLVAD